MNNGIKRIRNAVMGSVATLYFSAQQIMCDDIFTAAGTAVSSIMGKIWDFAKVAYPLAVVICLVCIIFTRDKKAMKAEIGTAIAITIAFVVLYFVKDSQSFVDSIGNLFGLSFS